MGRLTAIVFGCGGGWRFSAMELPLSGLRAGLGR